MINMRKGSAWDWVVGMSKNKPNQREKKDDRRIQKPVITGDVPSAWVKAPPHGCTSAIYQLALTGPNAASLSILNALGLCFQTPFSPVMHVTGSGQPMETPLR
tara:strand:- start:1881 stop:2189 length:309 start_codon:yes stop_codon:yes gene_type:complete